MAKSAARPGFSLTEVLISVALFVVIMITTTQIFDMVIRSQRSAIATQNVQESLKYFLEVTAKEMRMAQKDEGICPNVADDQIFTLSYNPSGQVLYFKNYYKQCVAYYLSTDSDGHLRFTIDRDGDSGYISPSSIRVDNLGFYLTSGTNYQPMVTITLHAYALSEAQRQSEMTIQTSVTSRYYK